MRFIEEWGSGLRRVNKIFAEYGLQNISLEDAGFAVKMNVYRSVAGKAVATSGDEPVNSDLTGKKRKDGGVNGGVNGGVSGGVNEIDAVIAYIKEHPGLRTNALTAGLSLRKRTLERHLGQLNKEGRIEFRGAPKTGGYYCKDEPLA